MKCFPLTCIKIFIGAGSVITILLSIGLLIVTIYSNLQKDKVIASDSQIIDSSLIGLYIAAVLFLLMGVAGLYGSIKKNRGLLCIFFIGTFLFFLVFLGGMLLFFIAPGQIFDGQCTSPKNSYMKQFTALNTKVHQIMCTPDCPCNLNITRYNDDTIYNDTNTYVLNDTGANTVLQCPNFDTLFPWSQTDYNLMKTLENQLTCGGWCDDTFKNYYYFKGMNSDPIPSNGCFQELKTFSDKYSQLLGLGCSVSFAFAALNLMMICCFCFHPSKTGSSKNFYKRMVEDD